MPFNRIKPILDKNFTLNLEELQYTKRECLYCEIETDDVFLDVDPNDFLKSSSQKIERISMSLEERDHEQIDGKYSSKMNEIHIGTSGENDLSASNENFLGALDEDHTLCVDKNNFERFKTSNSDKFEKKKHKNSKDLLKITNLVRLKGVTDSKHEIITIPLHSGNVLPLNIYKTLSSFFGIVDHSSFDAKLKSECLAISSNKFICQECDKNILVFNIIVEDTQKYFQILAILKTYFKKYQKNFEML